jgi:hypothetical protein
MMNNKGLKSLVILFKSIAIYIKLGFDLRTS